MKTKNKQFDDNLESFKSMKLEDASKQRIKNVLMSHIETHSETHAAKPSPYFSTGRRYYMKPLISTFVLVLFITLGTAEASQNSLPGDLLYPIKTKITEPLIKLTKINETEKMDFDLKLADTRTEELKKLIETNKATKENVNQNLALFEEHLKNSKNEGKDMPKVSAKKQENNDDDKDKDENDDGETRTLKSETNITIDQNSTEADHEDNDSRERREKYKNLIISNPNLKTIFEKDFEDDGDKMEQTKNTDSNEDGDTVQKLEKHLDTKKLGL